MRLRLAAISLILLGCSSTTTPEPEPEAVGQWGGREASLVLAHSGGALSYQCGHGTIDGTWTVGSDGSFLGAGQHFFGGGPLPAEGRQPHPASYEGEVAGDRFTLVVTLTDLAQTLGPFQLARGGDSVTELCL